ncbi:MAG: DUF1080 domain-containing protein, partial [Pirellulales bacterium]|nr:DUF1080 domain-containing protein [Pirellulales bacterium]
AKEPAAASKLHSAIRPEPRNGPWKKRHEAFNARVKQGNVDLLLIGDSITHAWEGKGKAVWDKFYAPRNAVNLGIGGDRTQHVLWRLDHGNLDGISPKLAVLMIGTNNSGSNTPEEIADGVKHIVQKLRAKLPETKVLILAIFPRGAGPSDARRQVNQKANALIAKLADGQGVEYLDIGPRFLGPDGTLARDVMPDLLHPAPAAYQTWAEAIEPSVSKVMGPLPSRQKAPKASNTEQGFVPLFDGKTLSGWRKAGGNATYAVEDGCIVGRRGPGRANTFLCTEKTYGDFVLELETKFDVLGNSGIQLRSHQRNGNGRVFGYQCELDPTPRRFSGGLYDEARRGWLYSLEGKEKARAAMKLDDWNTIKIQAIGPSIKTWINGVPCADLIDPVDLEGFIALQVHSGKEGQIRWRNIRLKDLGRRRWKPIFDGKTFDGWHKKGAGDWKIVDGAIHGTKEKSDKQFGHLVTDRQYDDFAVRLKFLAKAGDSGLYFRVGEGGHSGIVGFQAEIDMTPETGGLYESDGRKWVVKPDVKLVKKIYKVGKWNTLSVVAIGRRMVVHLNGIKTAELLDDPGRTRGHIALQLHGGKDMDVQFKDIEVLDLNDR